MPFGLQTPRWMLEIGCLLLQTESELVLKSRRVVPARLLESGFEFRLPMQTLLQSFPHIVKASHDDGGKKHSHISRHIVMEYVCP